MNYGELFEKAWKIIWKFKILWVFGLLSSCASRSGGGSQNAGTNYNFESGDFRGMPFENMFPGLQNFLYQLENQFQNGSGWPILVGIIAGLLLLFCILWVLFLVLGTYGRIGLVRGAWLADEGAEHLTFSQLWSGSSHYFWRVFLFLILLGVVSTVLGILLIIPAIIFTLATLCLGLLVIIAIVWIIQAWVELTIVAIVGEDLDVMDGIRRSWEVIRNHWGPVILVSLILIIGSGIAQFLIVLPFFAVALPIAFGMASQSNAGIMTSVIVAFAIFLLYLPVALALNGAIQSYVGTVWTLLYRRLTGRFNVASPVVVSDPMQPAPPEPPSPVE